MPRGTRPVLVVVISSLVIAITAAELPGYRTVVDLPSLKVKTPVDFPNSLSAEVFVGPKPFPYFRTEGRQRVDTATIDVNPEISVSVLSKIGDENAYLLYLFSVSDEGRVFGVFDLNCDGVWDVKRTPTKEIKQFIYVEHDWLPVDSIDDLRLPHPTATKDGRVFTFNKSAWNHEESE